MAKRTKRPIPEKDNLSIKDPSTFLTHAHDKYLKYVIGKKEVAVEFINYFVPIQITSKLKLNTLRLESGSFLDTKLSTRYADLVFSVELEGTDELILVNIIWEFKSGKEKLPFAPQLLRYLGSAIDTDLKEKREIRLTIPILLYHGEQVMRQERLLDLYPKLPAELKGFVPDFDFIMINIQSLPDETIDNLEYLYLSQILFVLKYSRNKHKVFEYFDKMIIFADENEDIIKIVTEATMYYLSATTKIKLTEMETLIAKMPKNKVKIPKGTIFEAMLEREARGEARGKAEGKVEGKAEGKAEVILALIKRFPTWTDQEIADAAGVKVDFVRQVRAGKY